MKGNNCCHVSGGNVCRLLQKKELQLAILLLLLQSSAYLALLGNGDVYECNSRVNSHQTVSKSIAKLTTGCIAENYYIEFDLGRMYSDNITGDAVEINMYDTSFINSMLSLINAHTIRGGVDAAVPVYFTMNKTHMTGISRLQFGRWSTIFKLPPHSRLRILNCQLNIISTASNNIIFSFYSLQLVTNSSLEIAHNVIVMDYKTGTDMSVFVLRSSATETIVEYGSSFIILNNVIKMTGEGLAKWQYIWDIEHTRMRVSNNSVMTFVQNTINMVGNNVTEDNQQCVLMVSNSPVTITANSMYNFTTNNISMVTRGKANLRYPHQSVWYQSDSIFIISVDSVYIWTFNNIGIEAYIHQYVKQFFWVALGDVTITARSRLVLEFNRIIMLASDYVVIGESAFSVMASAKANTRVISDNSKMIWTGNCVVMGQKKQDRGWMFRGVWTIIGDSELLWDSNYFTTSDEYSPTDGNRITEFLWSIRATTAMTINTGGRLTIMNTTVHANTRGAAYSMMWNSSLDTYNVSVNVPGMAWNSYPALNERGTLIPPMDDSNLRKFMCIGFPNYPAQRIKNTKDPTVTPTISVSVTKGITETDPSLIDHCSEVTDAPHPAYITISDLFTNGAVFEFTVSRPLPSDGGNLTVVVQALLLGEGNAPVTLVAKCHTAKKGLHGRYTCRFPLPPASLPNGNVSSIFLRYMPSPGTYCPLGIAAVLQAFDRSANLSIAAFLPVCPVMANGLTDGSAYVLLASCPCAPEGSQEGAKVAMNIIAPFSIYGYAAAVFGNICMTVFPWAVVGGLLYAARRAKWDIIIHHPIMKYTFGFRATLLGIWFWLAELTYPGVVVGTFGLMRTGDIGIGAVGCVYLVLIPVMAMVVMGPLRSRFVTYEEIYVGSHQLDYGMCHSLLTPQGMWGGTGPALGPVTQPFAGIRKAAVCAPLSYIVMAVVGAVLHTGGPSTSCVARLSAVAVLLAIVGVVIAVTRPCRYAINSLLYTVTFVLLAVYTALLTITASRHDEAHKRQEDSSYRVGFAQLGIGVYILLVFLVRGAVFVVIMFKEGCGN